MKPPDPKRNGDPRKEVAAHVNPSRVKPDEADASVKALRLTRWLDMAIVMHRMGATDAAEFQRLGIWLNRMRKAVQ